jgi:tRNA(Arg) A34 adenosine deaminase TadA
MLVTTVEPCLMCVGAALRLGVNQIAFGMDNPNAGRRLLDDGVLIQLYQGGILEARARELMESG